MKLGNIDLKEWRKRSEMKKKASIIDIFVWLAVSFIAVVFFAAWIYGFDLITTTLSRIDQPIMRGSNESIANISADTFGQVNAAQTTGLHLLAVVLIFSMGISIPITNFVQKSHPVFFLVYLFVIIAGFIVAVEISNQYDDLKSNPILGDTLTAFRGAGFIMSNLPIWTTILGLLGAVFLFSGILRDAGAGGSVV